MQDARGLESIAKFKNTYRVEVFREGKCIYDETFHNLMTLEGRRYLLDVAMNAGGTPDYYTNQADWYVILSSSNDAAASGMNYVTKVFTEFTAYDEATRPAWTQVTHATDASITNSASKAVFTVNGAGGTIEGAGLVSRNTKSDSTSGDYLLSYSKFSSPLTVVDNDVVNVTVTIALS